MNANSTGQVLKYHSFGESHGRAMGVVIEGCPAGLSVSMDILTKDLERRRPGKWPWTSLRKEPDQAEIMSGVFEGKSLGTPIAVLVFNKNQKSKDYESIKKQARSGHSEDLWKHKFIHYDHRGGGRSSGRETLGRVIAGSFARMILQKLCPKIKVMAFIRQIADIQILPEESQSIEKLFAQKHIPEEFFSYFPHKNKSEQAKKLLIEAKLKGESLGSLVELWIENLPKALGQPIFHKFKSDLAKNILSLGASTALEFGLGKDSVQSKGSIFHSKPENYGGLRGGLTTGERLCLRASFKPPSSLGKLAKTGRHDPCIGPRVLPVIEAISLFIIADHLLWNRLDRI